MPAFCHMPLFPPYALCHFSLLPSAFCHMSYATFSSMPYATFPLCSMPLCHSIHKQDMIFRLVCFDIRRGSLTRSLDSRSRRYAHL
ncbi:hypothetical protein EDB19DRAFT_1717376 [Suillus lakei]|nr:hypothetical protein EDB19DRAFT_1717376 [Suillus lakei]